MFLRRLINLVTLRNALISLTTTHAMSLSTYEQPKKSNIKINPVTPETLQNQDSLNILHPQPDRIYRIKNKAGEFRIRFEGDTNSLESIDVTTLASRSKTEILYPPDYWDRYFIPKLALPTNYLKETLPPVLLYLKPTNIFYSVSQISFNVDYNKYDPDTIQSTPIGRMATSNAKIQKDCQKLNVNIPTSAGDYPIFCDTNRPSYAFLEKLFQSFLDYNNPERLKQQYQHSSEHCFLRAHFVNELLDHYGIQSLKITKYWNSTEWPKSHSPWSFHTAAMVVTDENKIVVWDPWVGGAKLLDSYESWVTQQDHPVPKEVLITSKAVLVNHYRDEMPIGSDFRKTIHPSMFRIFLAISSNAVPNPPQYSLSLSLTTNDSQAEDTADYLPTNNVALSSRFFKTMGNRPLEQTSDKKGMHLTLRS